MANLNLPENPRRILKAFALVSSIGAQFAASVFIGFIAGRYADAYWGTDPWLMLAGVFLGVAGGFFGVYHLVTSFYKDDDRQDGRKDKKLEKA